MKQIQFDRPVIVLSAPRSGSTLMYEVLAKNPRFSTVGGESHSIIEGMPELRIDHHQFHSNMLTVDDATATVKTQLLDRFIAQLCDGDGNPVADGSSVRFLEKTPKNSLRVEFLNEIFPDALFIFLVRHPAQNIASIMEAWRSGRFITYPYIPGWMGPWSLLLPPQWRSLVGKRLVDVAAHQWIQANSAVLHALNAIEPSRWMMVDYQRLVTSPAAVLADVAAFADVPSCQAWADLAHVPMQYSRYTLTKPDNDKWKKYHADIASVWPSLQPTLQLINNKAQPFGFALPLQLPN